MLHGLLRSPGSNKKPKALEFTPKNIPSSQYKEKNSITALPITSSKQLRQTIYTFIAARGKFCRGALMATSISATGFKGGLGTSFYGSWVTSVVGEDYAMLAKSVPNHVRVAKPVRAQPMMKNVNEGKGLFAPIVVVTRQIIGKKRFNQLRGKAIALHSQVITEFCKSIGADAKQRQGLIRLAKKNGERLGFLA